MSVSEGQHLFAPFWRIRAMQKMASCFERRFNYTVKKQQKFAFQRTNTISATGPVESAIPTPTLYSPCAVGNITMQARKKPQPSNESPRPARSFRICGSIQQFFFVEVLLVCTEEKIKH